MLVSKKHQFVFISTTKCASTSIESMLRPHCEMSFHGDPSFKHTRYHEYQKFIFPYLNSKLNANALESICIVREPISWLYSWYQFRSRSALRNENHPSHMNCTYGMAFSEFIEAYVQSESPPFAKVGSQYEFVSDLNGELGVDTIYVYENMGAFVQAMSAKIGKQLKLDRFNVSPRRIHKSKSIARIVEGVENRLRLRFGYVPKKNDINPSDLLSDALAGLLKEHLSKDFELYRSVTSK